MPRPSTTLRLGLLLACLALASCSSLNNPFGGSRRSIKKAEQVPAQIGQARAEFDAGNTESAFERMRDSRKVRGLSPELRDEIETLLELYADRRIAELSQPGSDPGELEDMIDMGLPRQIAVAAGLRAARLRLDEGSPYRAFKDLKKLETRYPTHHGREEAGLILAEAGTILADDDWSFLGLFERRDKGYEVLEYLVLTYPSSRRGDEALIKLAGMYEDDGLWEIARERHEELLQSHFNSPLAIRSAARIPHLRLRGLKSPEYDRRELLRARIELEDWLASHPDRNPELERRVRLDLADCLQRLVASDLNIARFYRRVGRPYGARLHGTRALEVARSAGDERLLSDARDLLDGLPRVEELPVAPGEEPASAPPPAAESRLEGGSGS